MYSYSLTIHFRALFIFEDFDCVWFGEGRSQYKRCTPDVSSNGYSGEKIYSSSNGTLLINVNRIFRMHLIKLRILISFVFFACMCIVIFLTRLILQCVSHSGNVRYVVGDQRYVAWQLRRRRQSFRLDVESCAFK